MIMAKRTTKKTTILHRVNESLSGADLFCYTAAVFLLLGMLLPKSKGARPGAISSFYNSASIIRHHIANGNMQKIDGRIQLTAKGRAHFLARVTNDQVDKKESAALAKAMRSGKASDLPAVWKGEITLSEITITK
jgi:hypothetical protein